MRTICRENADEDLRWYIDRSRELSRDGFVASFRLAYERGRLDPSGQTTFDGRPAERYIVTGTNVRAEYYVDAHTGAPLGSRQVFPDSSITTTVEALDHLPLTPENVAKLSR